jgi:Tol biopolymer transport system component
MDLSTARVTTHTLPATDARPLAWSPDARRLAYVSTSTESGAGTLGVLDVETGHATEFPALGKVIAGAYSPDGSRLAVQVGTELLFLDGQGNVADRQTLPADARLAGPAAWSPDGALLAVVRTEPDQEMTWFLRPRALYFVPIMPLMLFSAIIPIDDTMQFQGWRSDRSVVFWQAPNITEIQLDGGARTVLASLDGEVVAFQLAADLLRTAAVVEPGPVDRGPWPTWFRLFVGLLLAAGAVPVLGVFWYVRRRRRRSA